MRYLPPNNIYIIPSLKQPTKNYCKHTNRQNYPAVLKHVMTSDFIKDDERHFLMKKKINT